MLFCVNFCSVFVFSCLCMRPRSLLMCSFCLLMRPFGLFVHIFVTPNASVLYFCFLMFSVVLLMHPFCSFISPYLHFFHFMTYFSLFMSPMHSFSLIMCPFVVFLYLFYVSSFSSLCLYASFLIVFLCLPLFPFFLLMLSHLQFLTLVQI